MKKQIWELLKEKIYYQDGSLRDIYMLNTTVTDWRKWVNFVNQNYKIEWYDSKTNITNPKIDSELVERYWYQQKETSTAKFFIDSIQINTHFFDESEIENDIDPREFKSIRQHYELVNYLTLFSNLCNKPIIVTPEHSPNIVLMQVYKGKMEVSGNNPK